MPNKYHNSKTVVDGITFDSKKEACRWCELTLMERAGEITNLQRQVKIPLIPPKKPERGCTYVANFALKEIEE